MTAIWSTCQTCAEDGSSFTLFGWRKSGSTRVHRTLPGAAAGTQTRSMTSTTNQFTVTAADVSAWVDRYLEAWESNDAGEIAALFTADGEYHEAPYETDWVGRVEIVDGWQSRWDWQRGGWAFEWTLVSVAGATAVITGIGRYRKLGDFDNHWTVTFSSPEHASNFRMVNNARNEEG
jgi:hypothetical protein